MFDYVVMLEIVLVMIVDDSVDYCCHVVEVAVVRVMAIVFDHVHVLCLCHDHDLYHVPYHDHGLDLCYDLHHVHDLYLFLGHDLVLVHVLVHVHVTVNEIWIGIVNVSVNFVVDFDFCYEISI